MEGNAEDKIRRSFGKREIDGEAWLVDNLHKAEMSEKNMMMMMMMMMTTTTTTQI
jgi:hypothetical protein